VLKTFKNDSSITAMNYSIPGGVLVVDANDNGFTDKVYVGDLGSQIWRLGRFTNSSGVAFSFPDCDENINNWQAQIILWQIRCIQDFLLPTKCDVRKRVRPVIHWYWGSRKCMLGINRGQFLLHQGQASIFSLF
jgi:hypothetical protein